jgi:hypothetical protein
LNADRAPQLKARRYAARIAMTEFWGEVLIELLPTEKGGRNQPLDLCNDHPGTYCPHFRVIGGSGELLGVAFMDGPDSPVLPGGKTFATVKSLYEPNVSYAELVEGARFEILEGPNVVGYGTVMRR